MKQYSIKLEPPSNSASKGQAISVSTYSFSINTSSVDDWILDLMSSQHMAKTICSAHEDCNTNCIYVGDNRTQEFQDH